MWVQIVWHINLAKKITRLFAALFIITLAACSTAVEREHEDAINVYLQLGVRYLALNDLPSAKENLERALKEDSDSVPAHLAMAFLYEKINKHDDARAQYELVLNLDPENLDLQNNYGRFLCERREGDKGMALLIQASNNMLNQNPWMALTNAGRCQLAMGDRAQAENYFSKALQANSSYAPLLQEMQKLSYQKGDFKAARDYFQHFMKVNEPTPEALWVAIQTEGALGNELLVKEYTDLLLEKFPFSNQAKQIKSTSRPQ